jgi:hypothetical protein
MPKPDWLKAVPLGCRYHRAVQAWRQRAYVDEGVQLDSNSRAKHFFTRAIRRESEVEMVSFRRSGDGVVAQA